MSQHSKLAPSNRYCWGRCPGAPAAQAKIMDTSGPAATDGSQTHWLLEKWLKEGKPPIVGMEYCVDTEGGDLPRFRLKEDRMERLKFTTDYIYGRIIEMDEQFGTDTVMETEQWIDNSGWSGRNDLNGTGDVVLINGSFFELIDLKDGMNPVSAEENEQQLLYALGILTRLMNEGKVITDIRITIAQPKERFSGNSGIDSWDIKTERLLEEIPIVIAQAEATDDPNAPRIPGDIQCKYCGVACSERNDHIFKMSGIDFNNVEDLPADLVAVENEPDIPNDRLRDMMFSVPLIKSMINYLEAEALRRFQLGNPIDGLKVVQGTGHKAWTESDEVIAKKLNKMGFPKAAPYKKVLITPRQAIKHVWTKKVKDEPVEMRLKPEQIEILERDFIKRNEGKLKVVSESAPGEPLLITQQLFGPVNEEAPLVDIPDWMK